jgi:hypothetical protein
MIHQIPNHVHPHMERGAFPFPDTMIPVRVSHEIERFSQLDQTIHEAFHDFEMGIGLTRTMNDQQGDKYWEGVFQTCISST